MDRSNTSNNDIVEIKDISVSAYLYSTNKVKLAGRKRLPSGEVLFQFTPKELTEKLIASYWNLEADLIQPKLLFSAQRDLKDLIFSN